MKKGNFVTIPTWLARNTAISPLAKTLYMAIRSYNPSFPSYSKLSKDTGIKSRTTISKYLKELVLFDLIIIEKSGFNRSNNYKINENPLNGLLDHNLNTHSPSNGQDHVQELDPNKNNIIKSIKAGEAASEFNTEADPVKHLNTEEMRDGISKILKGIY